MKRILISLMLLAAIGCGKESSDTIVTFPASAVGKEVELLRMQLRRFEEAHPDIRVELRQTPDASDQRHQLYVQWLNARASDPDVLQLDVVWTPEFAAAGWILPLEPFQPDTGDFFPATRAANTWDAKLFALPWFADVGMLYYRTDLLRTPPTTFEDLTRMATAAKPGTNEPHYGLLWQGARYEGLVCVFLEHLGGFGGQIMDDEGRILVDSEAAIKALRFMRDSIDETGIVPEAVLTWQEEQTRFGFQNGQAALLRNWPYAYTLMEDPETSAVAGRFAVTRMPATPAGRPTVALGGSQLAINANTEHPEAAYRVVEFLTHPEQMLERAQVLGQLPPRRSLYDREEMARAIAIPPDQARDLIDHAVPRPVTPVYTELSEILQIWIHRALTRQAEPADALRNAAAEMRRLLNEVGLSKQ